MIITIGISTPNFCSDSNKQDTKIDRINIEGLNSSSDNIGSSFVQYSGESATGTKEIFTSTENDEINIIPDVQQGITIENIFNKNLAVIDKSGNQIFTLEPILLESGNPISSGHLILYFRLEKEWVLIDSQYTSILGKCIFKFKLPIEIIQKTIKEIVCLTYKVSYKKNNDILYSKTATLIIKDYDGPKVEYINIYSRTDYEIHMKTRVYCYKEWWHLWTDDLRYLKVQFFTWSGGSKVLFKEFSYDFSNENYIGFTLEVWLWNFLKTGSALWIYVWADDKAGFSDSEEVYTTIIDDDTSAPSIFNHDDTSEIELGGGNIYDNYLDSYYLKVYGTDSSPWGVTIEYKFGDSGTVYSFSYDYRNAGSSWGTTRYISRSTWIQYIGEKLYWRYQAQDYDSDSGAGSADYSYTSWSSWIDGGMVLDDNIHAPTLDKLTTTGDINDSYLNDYYLKVKAQDGSGWKAEIQYKFGLNGAIHETTLSTSSATLEELIHTISKSTWINHVGKNIYWCYKLSDLDNDRSNDYSSHDWSDWLNAGQITDDDSNAPEIHIENIHNAALDSNYILFYIKDYSGIDLLNVTYTINGSSQIDAIIQRVKSLDSEEYGQAFKAFLGDNYKINTEIGYLIYVVDSDNDRTSDSLSISYSETFYIEKYLVNPKISAFSLSNKKLLPGMLFNVEIEIKNNGINKSVIGSKVYIYMGEQDVDGKVVAPAVEINRYSLSTINPNKKKTFLIPLSIDYEGYYFIFASVELLDANGNSYWDYWFDSVDISVKKLQFFITTNTTSMFPATNLQTLARFLNWAEKPTLDTAISIDKYIYDINQINKYYLETEYQQFGIVSPQTEISLEFEDIWFDVGLYEYYGVLTYNTLQGPRSIEFAKQFELTHPDVIYTSFAKYGKDYNEDPYPNEEFYFQLDIFNNADNNNITEIEIGFILAPDDIIWKKSGSINIEPGETFSINTPWHEEDHIGHFSYDLNITYRDSYNVIRSFIKTVEINIIPVPDLRIVYGDVTGNEEGKNLFPWGDNINGFPLKTGDDKLNAIKFEIIVYNDAHISVDFRATDLALKSLRTDYHYLDMKININEDTIEAKSHRNYIPEVKVTKTTWFNPNTWISMIINDVVDYAQLITTILTKGLTEISTVTKIFFVVNLLVDIGWQTANFLASTHFYEIYQYEGSATYTWQNGQDGQQLMIFPDIPLKISISAKQFNLYVISSILEICSSIFTILASMAFIAAQVALAIPFYGAIAYPILMIVFYALIAIEVLCDVFKYLCLLWSNNDPIDIDYNYLQNRLKQDVPANNSVGILTHNAIDSAVSIMNTTDQIILNEDLYAHNFEEGNYEFCSDLLEENSGLHTQNGLSYMKFGESIQGIFTEVQNNEYLNFTQGNFNIAYDKLNSSGLPDDELEILQDIGYNDAQIENLTQSVLKINDFEMVTNISNSIYNISKYFNTYGNLHLENSISLLNNSININIDYLHQSITRVTTEEADKLNHLKFETEKAVSDSNWHIAEYWASKLMNYSKYIVSKTNNQTYNSFLEYANEIIRYAELMLSLDLEIPVSLIHIKPGEQEKHFINIANNYDESILCEIILESRHKTWFSFNETIELDPYEARIIPIEIYVPKDYSISPGEYSVNVTIQRYDDTHIRDNDIFAVVVLPFYDFEFSMTNASSMIINPGNSIEYSLLLGNSGNVNADFKVNFIPIVENLFIIYPDPLTISLEPGGVYNGTFHIEVSFDWIGMSKILYNFTIQVIVLQNGFIENFTSSFTVKPTIPSYYRSIRSKIVDLIDYIEENLSWCASRNLNRYLDKSFYYLCKAYDHYILNHTHCSYCCYIKAKSYILSAIHKIYLFNKFGKIDDDTYTYLLSELRIIRNRIIILKGLTTNNEMLYKISRIIENLWILKDSIEDELSHCYGYCLQMKIYTTTIMLEFSILLIMHDSDPGCYFDKSIRILEHSKKIVNCLLVKHKISEEFANYLIVQITYLQEDINLLI